MKPSQTNHNHSDGLQENGLWGALPLETDDPLIPALIKTMVFLALHPIKSAHSLPSQNWPRILFFSLSLIIVKASLIWLATKDYLFPYSIPVYGHALMLALIEYWLFVISYISISMYYKTFVPAYIIFRSVTYASFYLIFIATWILVPLSFWFFRLVFASSLRATLGLNYFMGTAIFIMSFFLLVAWLTT